MATHHIELTDQSAAPLADVVRSMLRTFNQTNNVVWWEKLSDPAHAPRPLNVFGFDDSGEVVGGVLGETCLSWLKVFIMAVNENRRGCGIGSELLAVAEAEAIRRGCKYAFLDTLEYQAPAFYERMGYVVAAAIPDWDSHGHAKYFMTKTLAAPDA